MTPHTVSDGQRQQAIGTVDTRPNWHEPVAEVMAHLRPKEGMVTIQTPIIADVDVLIIGGSLGAVEAAVTLRQSGCSVVLTTSRTYLGDDICATLELWGCTARTDTAPGTDLWGELFGSLGARVPIPMDIKLPLEQHLVESGLEVLHFRDPDSRSPAKVSFRTGTKSSAESYR